MKFIPTALADVTVVEPDVFRDERGFFLETYSQEKYARGGITGNFCQDNHSSSSGNTVRGMHPQGKLVRVLIGSILDVVADIRRGSPTYLKWISVELSDDNFRQIYVPPGFAHGICITSEFADVEYKCTDYYDPADELRIAWNDAAIGIWWPIDNPILSDKDRQAPTLADQADLLPVYVEARP